MLGNGNHSALYRNCLTHAKFNACHTILIRHTGGVTQKLIQSVKQEKEKRLKQKTEGGIQQERKPSVHQEAIPVGLFKIINPFADVAKIQKQFSTTIFAAQESEEVGGSQNSLEKKRILYAWE